MSSRANAFRKEQPSTALADGRHLGIIPFDSKLAIRVHRRNSHLLNICTSQTNVLCVVSRAEYLLGLELALGHQSACCRPDKVWGLAHIWTSTALSPAHWNPPPLPSGSSWNSMLLFSLQLKMSYFEGHSTSFYPRWPESNVAGIHINKHLAKVTQHLLDTNVGQVL